MEGGECRELSKVWRERKLYYGPEQLEWEDNAASRTNSKEKALQNDRAIKTGLGGRRWALLRTGYAT